MPKRRRAEEGVGREEKKGNGDKSYQQMLQLPLWTYALSQLHSTNWEVRRRVRESRGSIRKELKQVEKSLWFSKAGGTLGFLPWATFCLLNLVSCWYQISWTGQLKGNQNIPALVPWDTGISGWWKLFTNIAPHSLQKAQLRKNLAPTERTGKNPWHYYSDFSEDQKPQIRELLSRKYIIW